MQSQLMLQVGSKPPQSFATGIEKLDIKYQLQRNCPPCDVVNLPNSNQEWSIVDAVVLQVTARSDLPDEKGQYHALSITAGDRPGLLYRVARVLGEYHLDLHTAKITTLGERAEDSFVISGADLAKPRAILKLEQDLLAALEE